MDRPDGRTGGCSLPGCGSHPGCDGSAQYTQTGCLLRLFPPVQAKAYLDRFEFHYTPKRGSWLNMAEIKIGVLKRQCLDRRIYDAATLRVEVAAWEKRHNTVDRPIDWQFTTGDARIKLRQLYPIEPRN